VGRGVDIDSQEPTRSPGPSLVNQPLDEGRFAPGTVLAERYRVVSLLGKGGMGEVYRADDLRLRQRVALKVLPPELMSDPTRLARLNDEVRLARQVTHPNVCRVHDVGEAGGLTFLTMEHVDGEDLAALLRRVGRLPAERAAVVGRQICAGLAAAHERGVLHRDLKPANIMIDGHGRARLTDFGLAVAEGDARGRLESAGTPAYMAPEQLEGRPVSTKTDIYALGLVLYELFTGRRAFVADSLPRLIELQRSSSPPAPTSCVQDLDPRVDRAILQCLEKDPARRPASAMDVASALLGPDALGVAVAAGEVPSPEMVAGAGEGASLSAGAALALMGLTVAVQLLAVWLARTTALFDQIPLDKRPEALAERAREILHGLGWAERPAERSYGFEYDRPFVRWRAANDPSPERSRRLATGQPAVVRFWYRESAFPIRPRSERRIVTANDPPLEAGMALVRLDTQGRLLELRAPPEQRSSTAPPGQSAWAGVLAAAGLDPSQLHASPRSWVPPDFADSVAAFEGTFPLAPAIPLRVEAASRAGRPVAFFLRGPWDEPGKPPEAPLGVTGFRAFTAVLVPVLLVALPLARRNRRLGRSDSRGAFRIAVFTFLCDLLYALLRYGHAGSALDRWFLFSGAAGTALFDAATAWVLYVALEPYVRRRWPQALVSWSRVLSGRFADPRVGRDVLVSGAAAACSVALFAAAQVAPLWRGRPVAPTLFEGYLDFLLGFPRLLAWLAGFVAVTAVVMSLMLVLLFVLLTALLRGRVAGAGALWLVYTLLFVVGVRPLPEQLPFYAAMAAVVVWVVVRHGVLALAVMYLFGGLLLEALATTHLGEWYGEPASLAYLLATGLIAWGLYASVSGRPFRLEQLLER
jgi:serine/threonine-protein kinase